jgi:hypothetical protein
VEDVPNSSVQAVGRVGIAVRVMKLGFVAQHVRTVAG